MRYCLAYDLGTGGVKSCLYDEAGMLVSHAFAEYETSYPSPGYQEQNPQSWWQAILRTTRHLLGECSPASVMSIGISGHSLGTVAVDKTGRSLVTGTPIWSDGRAALQAQRFFKQVDEKEWYHKTGGGFPAHLYTLFKIMWYRDEMPYLYEKAEKFLGSKDYINAWLTGALVTDCSYASGSGAYDLKDRRYIDEWITAAGIERSKLPAILPSNEIIGTLTSEAASALGLNKRTVVVAGGVDNACIALGANCVGEGQSYMSLGTSAWIAVSSKNPVVDWEKKPYVFEHVVPGQYVSATCIFSAGRSLKWVRDELCRTEVTQAREIGKDVYDIMLDMAALSPAGANRLLFNPSLAGGSSLDDSPEIRGAFIGLDAGHTLNDIIRSTLEGIALDLRIALDVLSRHVAIQDELLIVGGGGKSALWRQIFADVFEMNVLGTQVGQDAGALGAAALAALGAGIWNDLSPIGRAHNQKNLIAPSKNVAVYRTIMPFYERVREFLSKLGEDMAT